MSGLIGKKIGMTSLFDSAGKNIPCTIIECGPCVVTQVKTTEKDQYEAMQIGFGEKSEKNTNKPQGDYYKQIKVKNPRIVAEVELAEGVNVGDELKVDIFTEGEYVHVSGTSKGKGFQGVVKRHGFAGVGQATHGQHNRLRAPGSIGASSYPSRVFKGMRMAGRMGGEKVTVQNLEVLKVDTDKNLLMVKGAVPGHKNSFLIIKK